MNNHVAYGWSSCNISPQCNGRGSPRCPPSSPWRWWLHPWSRYPVWATPPLLPHLLRVSERSLLLQRRLRNHQSTPVRCQFACRGCLWRSQFRQASRRAPCLCHRRFCSRWTACWRRSRSCCLDAGGQVRRYRWIGAVAGHACTSRCRRSISDGPRRRRRAGTTRSRSRRRRTAARQARVALLRPCLCSRRPCSRTRFHPQSCSIRGFRLWERWTLKKENEGPMCVVFESDWGTNGKLRNTPSFIYKGWLIRSTIVLIRLNNNYHGTEKSLKWILVQCTDLFCQPWI